MTYQTNANNLNPNKMTTLNTPTEITTTRNERIEMRRACESIIKDYGYTRQIRLGEGSENSYMLSESANGTLNIVLTDDNDMRDIFEGMMVPSYSKDWMVRTPGGAKFPVIVIPFS